MTALAARVEVTIPYQPGLGTVSAFDRMMQITADELSMVRLLSYEIRMLKWAKHRQNALTERKTLNGQAR